MVTYADVKNHPKGKYERNDCGVVAATLAANADYGDVLARMTKRGRKRHSGTPMDIIWAVLEELGYRGYNETEKWVGEKIHTGPRGWSGRYSTRRTGKVKTVVTAERYLPKNNTYLVLTGGRTVCHILCVKRGKVQDWTEGRRNRVLKVWRIEKGEA